MASPVLLSQRQIEDHGNVQFFLDEYGLEYTNWSIFRKMYDSSLIIFLDLFTTSISTAGSSAANSASHEFGIGNIMAIFLFVSIYLFGQTVGGIIFPAYSEAFGRKKIYKGSSALFGILCVVIGAVRSLAAVAAGRFFCGFFSAIPTIVVTGSIEDMFNSKHRVWLIFIWAILANVGLALGPRMSVYITARLGWQWVFYVAAVVMAVITLLMFCIRESRPSLLLEREVAKLREETGVDNFKALNPDYTPDLKTFVRIGLFRPLHLFFTEPIVFMVANMNAVAFAFIYLFTEALPPIYVSMGFSNTSSYLPFLAICVGYIVGLLTRIQDHRKILKVKAQGIPLEPEHKLFGFSIGAPILAGGLWWFAWTIPPMVTHVHWIVSTIALVLIGYAVNEFDTVLPGYLADSYLSYSASGFAAVALLRSLLSAVFPLFATYMFDGLGANVASSALAALATAFCVIPPLFTKYGKQIPRSPFARHSLQVYRENGVDEDGY